MNAVVAAAANRWLPLMCTTPAPAVSLRTVRAARIRLRRYARRLRTPQVPVASGGEAHLAEGHGAPLQLAAHPTFFRLVVGQQDAHGQAVAHRAVAAATQAWVSVETCLPGTAGRCTHLTPP